MNIVQINLTCGTGSTGRLICDLATEIDKTNNVLIAFSTGLSLYKNSIRIGNIIDHKFHALLSRITGLQGYFSTFATYLLIKKLNKYKPDIVQLNNLHGNYLNLKMLLTYLKDNDIVTILTLHDCWFYTGKCTYYLSAKCDKWKNSCGKCPLLHKDNTNPTFFFDTTKKCFRDKRKWLEQIPRLAVVGVSDWISNEARQSFLKKAHIVTIYNWVDFEMFHPRKSKLREKLGLQGKFVILTVSSRISVTKGYNEILALANHLPNQWAIVSIGKISDELPKNVIHVPHTNDAIQLAEYYSMADVCLNTTQYETFGMVTAEALSCGTPVIVYNNTASPELVGEGCGYVVEQEKGIEKIFEAIQKIEKNGKSAYSEKCVAYATNNFSKKNAARKYKELYQTMLKI